MYVVIEFTPGYLPENDDPPIFDQWNEAVNYVMAERQNLLDDDNNYDILDEGKGPIEFMLDVGDFEEDGFIYFDKRKMHDLGRLVVIRPYEEDLDGS